MGGGAASLPVIHYKRCCSLNVSLTCECFWGCRCSDFLPAMQELKEWEGNIWGQSKQDIFSSWCSLKCVSLVWSAKSTFTWLRTQGDLYFHLVPSWWHKICPQPTSLCLPSATDTALWTLLASSMGLYGSGSSAEDVTLSPEALPEHLLWACYNVIPHQQAHQAAMWDNVHSKHCYVQSHRLEMLTGGEITLLCRKERWDRSRNIRMSLAVYI